MPSYALARRDIEPPSRATIAGWFPSRPQYGRKVTAGDLGMLPAVLDHARQALTEAPDSAVIAERRVLARDLLDLQGRIARLYPDDQPSAAEHEIMGALHAAIGEALSHVLVITTASPQREPQPSLSTLLALFVADHVAWVLRSMRRDAVAAPRRGPEPAWPTQLAMLIAFHAAWVLRSVGWDTKGINSNKDGAVCMVTAQAMTSAGHPLTPLAVERALQRATARGYRVFP